MWIRVVGWMAKYGGRKMKNLLLGIVIGASLMALLGATTSQKSQQSLTGVELMWDEIGEFINGTAISRDGRIAIAWKDEHIYAWDTTTGERVVDQEFEREIDDISFSENHRFAIIRTEYDVIVWAIVEGEDSAVENFARY